MFVKKSLKKFCVCFLLMALTVIFSCNCISSTSVKADETTYINSVSITLNENIVVKFGVDIPAEYTNLEVKFTHMNREYIENYEVVGGQTKIVEFSQVTPQNMGENVAVQATITADGKENIVESKNTFTVQGYCEQLLAQKPDLYTNSQYETLKKLVVNFLNYGLASQNYIEKVAALPTVNLSAEQIALIGNEIPSSSDLAFTGETSQVVAWKGATLLFGSQIDMRISFIVDETLLNDREISLKVVPEGKTAEYITTFSKTAFNDKTVYMAVWKGVSVTNLAKIINLQVMVDSLAEGKEATYSVKSFVYAMQSSQNDNMKALATAVYNYGLSAKSFVEPINLLLEAEHSVHNGINVGVDGTTGATYASSGVASSYSNGAFVKGLANKTMTYNFTINGSGNYVFDLMGCSTYQSGAATMTASNLIASVYVDSYRLSIPQGAEFGVVPNLKTQTLMSLGLATLSAGNHSLTITFKNYGETYNNGSTTSDPFIDCLKISTSDNIILEAEKSAHTGISAGAGYDVSSGIASSFSGGGFVKVLNNKTMTFTINITTSGDYTVELFGSSSFNSGKSDMIASVLFSSVTIDGNIITLPEGAKFEAGTSDDAVTNFKHITALTFGSYNFTEGQHTIVINFGNYGATYFDETGSVNDPFVDYLKLSINN